MAAIVDSNKDKKIDLSGKQTTKISSIPPGVSTTYQLTSLRITIILLIYSDQVLIPETVIIRVHHIQHLYPLTAD